VDRESRIVDGGEAGGESGPAGVMSVFIPPPIFREVETVFDPPMTAHMSQEVGRRDSVGIETRNEVADVVRYPFADGALYLAVNAND
jgi:hypothetical protein